MRHREFQGPLPHDLESNPTVSVAGTEGTEFEGVRNLDRFPAAISDPLSLLEDMRLDRDSGDSKREQGMNSKRDERDDWRDRTRKREHWQ